MLRFTQLFIELDRTTRTSEKQAAMVRYFRDAPPQDSAWALYFLSGRKIKRLVGSSLLHEAIRSVTGLPEWLLRESYESVGDSAELLALLYPRQPSHALDQPLHQLVQERMLKLRTIADPLDQIESVRANWEEMNFEQRLVFNKLITGNFRVGVAQTLIVRALAEVAGVPAAVMTHRFMGGWEPTAASYQKLFDEGDQGDRDRGQPYPFFLGYPIESALEDLGDVVLWQAEWKYDGIRAQVIHRGDAVLIWSRGDELITHTFPEIANAAADLPDGSVLDGEIVAWENHQPLPFALLQRRLNRKTVEATLWTDVPVAFIAFDLLEHQGVDIRDLPLLDRRQKMNDVICSLPGESAIHQGPTLQFRSWDELAAQRSESRSLAVEGVVIKRMAGSYGVGRRRGEWWKWKIDPYTIDAVLIYAQGGSGRRSGLFTDYTFGLWDRAPGQETRLVPVAKAYSGLTDDEIRQVDRFIRANTIEKHGPVRVVKPELVFELAFEGIQESNRHKAGIAIRFPRMNRWRTDKKSSEADTIDALRNLLKQQT